MARTLYGSYQNRIMENHHFTDEIKVGTGMTKYSWTDREAYEVIEVKDQKHVTVRLMDHKHIGEACMDNNWELISNENNPSYEMTKRGKYWYTTVVITSDILDEIENCTDADEKFRLQLFLAHNDIDPDKLRAKGKITKYYRENVSFGHADYYYDYEF
jgi:hypothetical protein